MLHCIVWERVLIIIKKTIDFKFIFFMDIINLLSFKSLFCP